MFMKREDIEKEIEECIKKAKNFSNQGEVASYIPELKNVDENGFAHSIILQIIIR